MTLYEIDSRITGLIDPETGEVGDYDTLSELAMERNQKLENMACWIKNMKADIAGIAAEIKALQDRKKAIENRMRRITEHLQTALDGQKFETARCSVSYRKSTSVAIDALGSTIAFLEKSGRDDCLKYKPPEVSKTDLKDLIKSGIEVPGCHIEEKANMTIK
ncbi:MAG: siphovirus Gp157 family protein [Prevotella sp.]